VGSNLPSSESSRQNVDDLLALLATIRRHAFDLSVPPGRAVD
jgi:hypothetical protein